MLINKPLSPNDIITLKLVTGEEVIAKFLEDTGTNHRLHKPLVLSITPNGVAMTPFLFTAEIEGDITIPKTAIIATAATDKQTAGQYIKGTTGIQPVSGNGLGKLI